MGASGVRVHDGVTAPGTTRRALARIAGVLGLLVLVAAVLGVLQVLGSPSAWGLYGPLAGSGLLWCVVIWRGRHEDPVAAEGVTASERLLEVLAEERATPRPERASRCSDDELAAARPLADAACAAFRRGRADDAAGVVLELQGRARREGWYLTSPLRRQLETLVEVVERQQERERRTPWWWQWSMTQQR